MDPARKTQLIDAGINIDSALERFMGNEKMLEKYLNRFLEEKSYSMLTQAMQNADAEQAAAAAHMLKSVCGSIGCEEMQQMTIALEKDLKAGQWDSAVSDMRQIEDEYKKICCALKKG